MQSGGGPLQPGPPVMRGLASGTPSASQQQQQQVEMQKMQSQAPPLMNQQQYQQQQPNVYRNPGANQSTRPTRPILTPYGHTTAPLFAPFIQMPYSRFPGHQWNYGSMPGMASYPPQYYIQSAPILAQGQHQQTRRNPAGDNSLVNMQQVPLPQPQPPNQQSSPITVTHDMLVMQQLHPQQQQPQQTPQQVTGGGQAPMDQHQPNPAQVSVGGPQAPPNALMSQIQLASHLAATGAAPVPAKVNKKKQRGSRAIPIINPDTQEDLLDKIYNDSAPTTSSSTVVASTPGSGAQQQPPPQQQQQQPQPQPPQPAATPTYNTIPPNVTQVPLNPAPVEPDYDNYTSHHPHQATPELSGPPAGMGPMHHQPPPHLHHPPPLNHPPPHVHPHGPPQMQMQMAHDHRGGPPQVNTQQQPPPPHELTYHGTMKYATPPPHLPHHPSPAEMTVGGTPVVSAIADGPSVEIKPYQNKKKKPTNEHSDHQQQQIKSLPASSMHQQHPQPHHHPQQPPHHHHMQHNPPPQQQQPQPQQLPPPVVLNESVPPPSLVYPERYRTISEKSIAESTLSTDAEPFVYTGPSSAASVPVTISNQPPQPVHIEQAPSAAPEVVSAAVTAAPFVPAAAAAAAAEQHHKQEVVEEAPKTTTQTQKQLVDSLVAGVEKLSVEENSSAGANQTGGHSGNKKKQHKKRADEPAAVASETSIHTSGSKAAAPATVVIEQQTPASAPPPPAAAVVVAAVDETDRSAVVVETPQQQQLQSSSSSSSLISNLVEHNNSKLDNDNIINNNNVDCTSTMITKPTTDNTTDNNNAASSPMEKPTPKQDAVEQQQPQQPEFDDNKNVLVTAMEPPTSTTTTTPLPAQAAVVAPETAAPAKDSTPDVAMPPPSSKPVAATIPAKKSRSITLIEYDPDQWSPDNPAGKRKYSRDQLMQLKNAAPAREKPANLPNSLENVLIRSNHGGGGGGGGGHGMGMGGGGGQYGKSNFSEMLLPTFFKDRGGGGGGGGGGGNMGQIRQQYITKRPSQQGNSGQSGSQSNKQSQQGMSKTGSKIIRLQLDEEVKLNECANAWRPRHLQQSVPEVDPDTGVDRTTQELFKKFRSVLNKLTPDNFDKLVQQVKGFVIDTDERLDGCIKLVFEKAISEPNFSEAYAKMCKEIGNIAVLVSNEKRTSFKGRLLAQCQCEFERRRNDQTSAIRDNRSKLEANKGLAKEQFEELKAQLEEEELKVRRRAVGTVRFIGELFKHGQLTANIMHSCITLLIEKEVKDYDEETLECLCKLLTTIGSKMEKENNQDLSGYFDKMGDIVKHRDQYKISSRIRFMIQDVIDLRRNGWQPRRQDLNPKTMNQIQKEAETEQLQINMNYMSGGRDRGGGGKDGYGGDMGGRGNRGGSMQGNKMSGSGYNQGSLGRGGNQGSMKGGRPQQDDDGFQHVVSNSRNNRSTPIDLKKINIPGSVDTTRLGAASAYQGWKNNSNIFAALNNEESSQGGGQGNMMDRESDRDRRSERGGDRNQRDRDRSGSHNKNSGGKDSYHHYNKGSMERDRYNRYGSSSSQNDDRMGRSSREPSSGSMRPMSGQHSNSQMHERDRDRDRDRNMGKMPSQQQQPLPGRSSQQRHIPQSAPAPPSSSGAPVRGGGSSSGGSGSTMSKSGSGQLYQQQQLPQFAIPKDAVRRNFPHPDASTDEKLKKFSKAVHLEMVAVEIVECVNMLDDINPDYYHAAINELLMDNLERDVKSREAVVKVIAEMFKQKRIGKADYLHALEEVFKLADDIIIDLPQLYKYIATFYVLLLKESYITLADVHSAARPILASNGGKMLCEFLHQYESSYGQNATEMLWLASSLSFTDFIQLGSNEVEKYLQDHKLDYLLSTGGKALDMQTVGTQIKQFLKSGAKFIEIFSWVAEYVGPERVTSDEFIRTLTKAVIEHCIDNKTKLNVPEITKWHQILQKYIDSKPERELQAMYAIQRLVVELEHPQNLLHTILEQLYDFDVIMEGFSLWKDSTDPLEAAGKGVCLKGITQFMTMYMETSTDEDN